ncbi:MAG: peroxide stress protein YaaA [Desulfobulbus sp.]|nr:peroxide stress protein YaaA [Desulfobulbus sp.]
MIILSPSKGQQQTAIPAEVATTVPEFLEEAKQLLAYLRTLSIDEVTALMRLGPSLVERTHTQLHTMDLDSLLEGGSPALLTFRGSAFLGIDALQCSTDDLVFAQQHVRILSGLYGILRPLDRMLPYRLEMGTPVPNALGKNLYDYWRDRVTAHLNTALALEEHPVLINLASKEYAGSVLRPRLTAPWLDIQFKEEKGGQLRTVTIYTKKARGMMAGFFIRRRIDNPEELKDFQEDGYRFRPELSTDRTWVFTRPSS